MPDHRSYNVYRFKRDKLRTLSEEAKQAGTHKEFLSALAETLRVELDREYHHKESPLMPELAQLASVILSGVRMEKSVEPDLQTILNSLQQARDGLITKLSPAAQAKDEVAS